MNSLDTFVFFACLPRKLQILKGFISFAFAKNKSTINDLINFEFKSINLYSIQKWINDGRLVWCVWSDCEHYYDVVCCGIYIVESNNCYYLYCCFNWFTLHRIAYKLIIIVEISFTFLFEMVVWHAHTRSYPRDHPNLKNVIINKEINEDQFNNNYNMIYQIHRIICLQD